MNSLELGRARRQEEHIVHAQQMFGPGAVQNGAGIHLGGNLEGDAGGEIRLDETGQHVNQIGRAHV